MDSNSDASRGFSEPSNQTLETQKPGASTRQIEACAKDVGFAYGLISSAANLILVRQEAGLVSKELYTIQRTLLNVPIAIKESQRRTKDAKSHDLYPLVRSLKLTIKMLLDSLAGREQLSQTESAIAHWDSLCNRFEKQGFGLLDRLDLYKAMLHAAEFLADG